VGGVDLYALEISNTAGQDTGKPQVKYVANIHGNEPSGRCEQPVAGGSKVEHTGTIGGIDPRAGGLVGACVQPHAQSGCSWVVAVRSREC